MCLADHCESGCVRGEFFSPRFVITVPLDKSLRPGRNCDLIDEGKERLAAAELDPSLKSAHWAPECRTFSRARGRLIQLPDGSWIQGP